MNDKVKKYYHDRVNSGDRNNFLWQVGKTVNGKEVSKEQIELIVETINSKLQLNKNDIVLDVGCGNGLLTKKISSFISKITGLELTEGLFEIAEEYHSNDNILYINSDIINFDVIGSNVKYTKIYLYEVMQHFTYIGGDAVFSKLYEISADNAAIFIGGILDAERKWMFFDSKEKRCRYFKEVLSGNDPLGTWYHKDVLHCLANKYNFHVECIEQENMLYTNHYRFDCLLRKK